MKKFMPKNNSLRKAIADLTMRFNWQTPEDGKRMLGWLACASISAVLSHRLHVWLSGYPGKTWFVEKILDLFLQPHYHLYASPSCYSAREGSLCPQIIDMADYRDSNNKIINSRLRGRSESNSSMPGCKRTLYCLWRLRTIMLFCLHSVMGTARDDSL